MAVPGAVTCFQLFIASCYLYTMVKMHALAMFVSFRVMKLIFGGSEVFMTVCLSYVYRCYAVCTIDTS